MEFKSCKNVWGKKIFLVKMELNPAGEIMIPFRGPKPQLVVQKDCHVDHAQDHHLCQYFPSRKRSPNYTPLKLDLLPMAQAAALVQLEVDQVHF